MLFCESVAHTSRHSTKLTKQKAPCFPAGLGNPSPLGAAVAVLTESAGLQGGGWRYSRRVGEELGTFWIVSGDEIWGPGSLEKAAVWKVPCVCPWHVCKQGRCSCLWVVVTLAFCSFALKGETPDLCLVKK